MEKAIITYTKHNIPRKKAESRARARVHAQRKGQEELIGVSVAMLT